MKYSISEINNKIPENIVVCEEILKQINNEDVKIKLEENYDSSFYNIYSNEIIISNSERNKKHEGRLTVIAHECVHSKQNKTVLWINFILSNILIILSLINILDIFLKFTNATKNIIILNLILSAIGLLIRLYLEKDAINKSKEISVEYLKNKIHDFEKEDYLRQINKEMNKGIIFFYGSIALNTIVRLLVIIILYNLFQQV